jgi:hypothetical protein
VVVYSYYTNDKGGKAMDYTNLTGIYWLLAVTPVWITVVTLLVFCIGILYPGRKYFEGVAYNVAYSSNFGDMALIGNFMIAVWGLQNGGRVPMFANRILYQLVCLAISALLGIVWQFVYMEGLEKKGRVAMIMDSYHNLVVAPMLIYLILFVNIPVMFASGNLFQWLLATTLVAIWAKLVFVDSNAERLDQQIWLRKNKGINLPVWRLPE